MTRSIFISTILLLAVIATVSAVRTSGRGACSANDARLPDSNLFPVTEVSVGASIINKANNLFPEGTSPDPMVLATNTGGMLDLAVKSVIKITFVHEGAGYRNQMGYWTASADDDILSETTVFRDLSFYSPGCHETGDQVTVGPFDAGTRVGFFICGNCFNRYRSHMKFYSTATGKNNRDGKRHVGLIFDQPSDNILIGMEDLYNLGDKDYNDAMFFAAMFPVNTVTNEVADESDTSTCLGTTLNDLAQIDVSGELQVGSSCENAITPNTSNLFVQNYGKYYTLIDGTDPTSAQPGCQHKYYALPAGWRISDMTPHARQTITGWDWGTLCPTTAGNDNAGAEGGLTPSLGNCDDFSVDKAKIDGKTDANGLVCYIAKGCDYRILIEREGNHWLEDGNAQQTKTDSMLVNGDFTEDSLTTNTGKTGWTNFDGEGVTTTATFSGLDPVVASCTGTCGMSQTSTIVDALDGVINQLEDLQGFSVCANGMREIDNSGVVFTTAEASLVDQHWTVYVDVAYTDGTSRAHYASGFSINRPGVTERRCAQVFLDPLKNVTSFTTYLMNRFEMTGAVVFSDVKVEAWDGNWLKNNDLDQLTDASSSNAERAWTIDPLSDFEIVDSQVYNNAQLDPTHNEGNNAQCSRANTNGNSVKISSPWGADKSYSTVYQSINHDQNPVQGLCSLYVGYYCKAVGVTGVTDSNFGAWVNFNSATEGQSKYSLSVPCKTGTHDWQYNDAVFQISGGLKSLSLTAGIFGADTAAQTHTGTAYFDRFYVKMDPRCPGGLRGIVHGDPHIVSIDGVKYDLQSHGEFVLSKDNELEVHARFEPAGSYASVVTGVGLGFAGNRISITRGAFYNTPALRINGATVNFDTAMKLQAIMTTDSSLSREGGSVQLRGELGNDANPMEFEFRFTTGHKLIARISVSSYGKQYFMLTTSHPSSSSGICRGLLGNCDGNNDNDFITADGTQISMSEMTTAKLYDEFAESYRVTDDSSFLHYATGKDTSSFTDKSFHQNAELDMTKFTAAQRAAAEAACSAIRTSGGLYQQCLYDVLATNDAQFAAGYEVLISLEGTDTPKGQAQIAGVAPGLTDPSSTTEPTDASGAVALIIGFALLAGIGGVLVALKIRSGRKDTSPEVEMKPTRKARSGPRRTSAVSTPAERRFSALANQA